MVPSYAIVDDNLKTDDDPETIYLLLEEEDGVTMFYSPSIIPDIETFADIFHSPIYKDALKKGETFDLYFRNGYTSGEVGEYLGDGRDDFDDVLERYREKYPDTKSRFFSA